jgi:hypothetical protein
LAANKIDQKQQKLLLPSARNPSLPRSQQAKSGEILFTPGFSGWIQDGKQFNNKQTPPSNTIISSLTMANNIE